METIVSADPCVSGQPFGSTYIVHKAVASDLCFWRLLSVPPQGQTALDFPEFITSPPSVPGIWIKSAIKGLVFSEELMSPCARLLYFCNNRLIEIQPTFCKSHPFKVWDSVRSSIFRVVPLTPLSILEHFSTPKRNSVPHSALLLPLRINAVLSKLWCLFCKDSRTKELVCKMSLWVTGLRQQTDAVQAPDKASRVSSSVQS